MAAAGVPFTVGREDNSTYGEITNGQQLQETHQFDSSVSPFRIEGDPDSGLLPFVESISDGGKADLYRCGSGDRRVQAYNFRVCMTRDPEIRVDFAKPDGYEVGWYELAARWLRDTKTDVFSKFDLVTPNKTDTNNHGAVSTDFIGGSQGWPEGTYREREQIFQEHIRWQKGLHWFMDRDERVPLPVRQRYAQWGLAEAAVIGINIARRTGVALQDVPYRDLAAALGHAGQVLDWDSENPPARQPGGSSR